MLTQDVASHKKNPVPRNFSWVVDGKLAAMGLPETAENMNYLVQQDIKLLITLSPECRPPLESVPNLLWTEIPIPEFGVPSLSQIDEFIKICNDFYTKDKAVGIHCRLGKGRTGTMAACYLVYFFNEIPQRAVLNVRMQRPGSIETYQQEKIVEMYYDYKRKYSDDESDDSV